MRIACIQTNPQTDVTENVEKIFELMERAVQKGSQLIVLPEMFTYMGSESERNKTKDDLGSGVFKKCQDFAKKSGVTLVSGSHSEAIQNNHHKVYNTCVTFDGHGNEISVYRKLHLFNLKDIHGNPIYCEEDSFESGLPPVPYSISIGQEHWTALNIICYDIRFPEVIRSLSSPGEALSSPGSTGGPTPPDIIFVPAAFTWQTGKDHWEVLLRARAIENQCFVVACNQTGFHTDGKKRNYGHSMVIDPWGNVIAQLGEECDILTCNLDKNLIVQSRTKLSALGDRKL